MILLHTFDEGRVRRLLVPPTLTVEELLPGESEPFRCTVAVVGDHPDQPALAVIEDFDHVRVALISSDAKARGYTLPSGAPVTVPEMPEDQARLVAAERLGKERGRVAKAEGWDAGELTASFLADPICQDYRTTAETYARATFQGREMTRSSTKITGTAEPEAKPQPPRCGASRLDTRAGLHLVCTRSPHSPDEPHRSRTGHEWMEGER